MTRLVELLIPTAVFVAFWILLVSGFVPFPFPDSWWTIVKALPAYGIITFGCYALASVGYSVYNVKSDDAAAILLQQDIKSAKLDLKRKGFSFDT